MREFRTAAQRDTEDDDVAEFTLTGLDPAPFTVRLPTTGQVALIAASLEIGGSEMLSSVFTFLRALMSPADYRRLRKHIADGVVTLEMLIGGDAENPDGIIDWVIGQATNRPPTRPTDSSPSPVSDGRRSTGRSPGAGSTRSASLPAAS